MLEFYFEYLRATGDLVKIVCEVHYEDDCDPDTDCEVATIHGIDFLGVSDELGDAVDLAPWEFDDAKIQAEERAIKLLLGPKALNAPSRWIA